MSILDALHVGKIKAELESCQAENKVLKETLSQTEKMTYLELVQEVESLKKRKTDVEEELSKNRAQLESEILTLRQEVEERKKEVVLLDEELLLQEFGFYKPQYALKTSEAYKDRLEKVRVRQEALVKSGSAAICTTNWTVNNSQREGQQMIKDYVKLILRSFNNECDACLTSVKYNNYEQIKKRIEKAYTTLNKLGAKMSICLKVEYYHLKIEELTLCYEYQLKKQEEKEEQRRIREQMREEAKLQKEIEEMKQKLSKEENHFCQAMEKLNQRLQTVSSEAEFDLLQVEKANIEKNLQEIEKQKLDVLYREQNTRAGYVYIISNVGSFGEKVYKIGVTRRLEPQERIDELGDASVPFEYDVHALIFSDDAPALEKALHKTFDSCRLNRVNLRREFFRVSLDEIEMAVKKNFKKPVEIIRFPEAPEYRQSLALSKARSN